MGRNIVKSEAGTARCMGCVWTATKVQVPLPCSGGRPQISRTGVAGQITLGAMGWAEQRR